MLSDRDRRTLREMEEALERSDERYASTFALRADRLRDVPRGPRFVRVVVVLVVLTVLLLVLGLASIALVTASLLGLAVLLSAVAGQRDRRGGPW
ncbi:DUF3040 domain-containing protein [Pseudonocardia sp. MH-G8]|uniref:DUF3040 domain-containing protein n=1 Tax=Pseudonocardia sp. MH-G8 TaxID=1854588 RepID=UPI000BA12939|nr:DUF3040 domain-containing protein [Pseudonocardia sp. MH-G8]OZM77210.1 hypothetical protein CFP66_36915 [Pseudonocardia sp. MH-G8]